MDTVFHRLDDTYKQIVISAPGRYWVCFLLFLGTAPPGRAHDPIPPNNFYCNLTFPQAAMVDVNTIYIPFTLVGQLMMVEAKVDTIQGYFMFDTGSERLVLNQEYFTLEPSGRSVAAIGNTGEVASAVGKQVDSIRIDQLVIRGVYAHIVDLHHIELKKNIRLAGILGYNVFKDFEVFIDFQNRVIVLRRVDAKGFQLDTIGNWEIPYDSIKFELKRHLIIVDTEVNAVRLRMILDSGAELNLLDRRVNRKVLDHFTIIKRVNLVGTGKREVEVLAGELKDIRCGHQYSNKMNTLLTSLDEINNAWGIHADGILGYEFLKTRRVAINYQKSKLYFFNPVRS